MKMKDKNCCKRCGKKFGLLNNVIDYYKLAKKKKIKEEETYWKLPATERLHYDSLTDKLPSMPLFVVTLAFIRGVIFLCGFLVFAGFMTDKLHILLPLTKGVFIDLMTWVKYFIIFDGLYVFWQGYKYSKMLDSLKKRFKIKK